MPATEPLTCTAANSLAVCETSVRDRPRLGIHALPPGWARLTEARLLIKGWCEMREAGTARQD